MHRGGYRGNFRGRGGGGGGRGRGGGGEAWDDGRYHNEGGTPEHPSLSGSHQRPVLETWGNLAKDGENGGNVQFRRGPSSRDDASRSRSGGGRGRGNYHGSRGGGDSYQDGPQRSTVIVFVR